MWESFWRRNGRYRRFLFEYRCSPVRRCSCSALFTNADTRCSALFGSRSAAAAAGQDGPQNRDFRFSVTRQTALPIRIVARFCSWGCGRFEKLPYGCRNPSCSHDPNFDKPCCRYPSCRRRFFFGENGHPGFDKPCCCYPACRRRFFFGENGHPWI